jgi:hypothetical protein
MTGPSGCAASNTSRNHENATVAKMHEDNQFFFVLLRAFRVFVVSVIASPLA